MNIHLPTTGGSAWRHRPNAMRGLVLLVGAILASALWPLAIVPAGHRGVMTTMGKPSAVVLGEGVHLLIPFVQKLNVMCAWPRARVRVMRPRRTFRPCSSRWR
jgi:regulator of protease activity HflC (stomatin/prohibitin superfamily)